MPYSEQIAKSRVLLEALPYIQSFRGAIFVIKYGGSFMDDPDPEVRSRVAGDIAFLAAVGIHAVVVHGGGKAISRAMAESGLTPVFQNGMRVTDEATIAVVKKTLDTDVNPDVCRMIADRKANALGMPGDTLLVAEKLTVDENGRPIDLGYVGDVVEVKVKLIKKAIADGFVPVISPVALGQDGKALQRQCRPGRFPDRGRPEGAAPGLPERRAGPARESRRPFHPDLHGQGT